MFNRYWRSYPWFLQLVQYIILLAVLASFFVFALAPIVLNVTGTSLADIQDLNEKSPRNVINAFMWIQCLTSIGLFLLPTLLFGYFTHPRPGKYLGLVKPGKAIHWILAPALILAAAPVLIYIASLISHLDLGTAAKKAQEANDRLFKGFLSMSSPFHFLAAFFVAAILPGVSEELFFRGLMMRFVAKRSRKVVFPIVFTALMFAWMHTNVYGSVSIFLAGIILGSIYYLTGSLWCSIIAHITFNGSQVIMLYIAGPGGADKGEDVPFYWALIGLLLFSSLFYVLWKNRTPLQEEWAQDYEPGELMETEQ
jgi:uncharacterized protein